MKKRLKAYIVTVKHTALDFYEVDAKSPNQAIERWMDGRFLHSHQAYLDAVAVDAFEKGA